MRICPTIIVLVLFAAVGCKDRYAEIQIAPAATISSDWILIRPPQPLAWTRPVEEISFKITSPHEIGPAAEIVMPDNQKLVPDVELITDDGKTYALDQHGFWGQSMFFTRSQKIAASIVAIRIRSRIPLQISNLLWRGYDPAKVKR